MSPNPSPGHPRFSDPVVLPLHYGEFAIEPIRFCIENNLDGFQFNVVKYVCRHRGKNGIEDLKKARRYIDMYIAFLQGDPDWWKPSSSPKAEPNG